MTVDADRRLCTEDGDALRIDVFLQRLAEGATISPTELGRLICDRSSRLAAHILGREPVRKSAMLSDEALRRLERELQRSGSAISGARLCQVAANHVWAELTDLLRRQPATRPSSAGDSGLGCNTTVVATVLATEESTLNSGLLDTWVEVQQGLARLETDLRQIIDLVYFAGLPVSAAATLISIPAATAQARWRVAKIRLAMAGANRLSDGL